MAVVRERKKRRQSGDAGLILGLEEKSRSGGQDRTRTSGFRNLEGAEQMDDDDDDDNAGGGGRSTQSYAWYKMWMWSLECALLMQVRDRCWLAWKAKGVIDDGGALQYIDRRCARGSNAGCASIGGGIGGGEGGGV
jgi:hypothetical protein